MGYCVSACAGGRYADWQDNRKCVVSCSRTPLALFGHQSNHKCVLPKDCPNEYYADNNSLLCIKPCTGSLPYADNFSRQCVLDCPDDTYGDDDLNMCLYNCSGSKYADNSTGNCETLCTLGTFGVNSTTDPRC